MLNEEKSNFKKWDAYELAERKKEKNLLPSNKVEFMKGS